jgi:hypothetical protein
MAHARRDDAYQDLTRGWSGQIDFFDAQRFIGFPGNSRSRLHEFELLRFLVITDKQQACQSTFERITLIDQLLATRDITPKSACAAWCF